MLVAYLRSSAIGAYKLCPTQYLIEYNLGIKGPSGYKAVLGNITHKSLETLLWKSKHERDGLTEYDDETFGRLVLKDVTVDWAVDSAFDYYKSEETHLSLTDKDRETCRTWVNKTLTMNQGYFNPANLHIVEAEKRFDITLNQPWAAYDYEMPDGSRLKGQLGLKGTVDLVALDHHDEDVIEIIDWKTGARKDWGTGKEKTYEVLQEDHQLLLYYYAFSQVYPDKHIIMTIVFINEGGPFKMVFGPDDLVKAEMMLKRSFETIKADVKPSRLSTWFCDKVCYFGKTKSDEDPSKTICQYVTDTVSEIGFLGTLEKLGRPEVLTMYQDGGGRKAKA